MLMIARARAADSFCRSCPGSAAAFYFSCPLIVGLAGVQLLAVGIVGEYVWRALEDLGGGPPT